jgi:hypothetical protein
MKKLLSVFIIFLVIVTFTLSACNSLSSSSIAGTYYLESDNDSYIQLKSNGTWKQHTEGGIFNDLDFSGIWEVSDTSIYLTDESGMLSILYISLDKTKLTNTLGAVWIKE